MKRAIFLYFAGAIMLVIFALNLYVGLVDRNLFIPPNTVLTPHYYFNWVLAAVDLIASAILIVRPSRKKFLTLSGVVWPLVYMGALGLDVASSLCLGAPSSTCFPSTSASASYLFLGNSSYAQVYFWPYTFVLILTLLISTILVSALGLYVSNETASPGVAKKESQCSNEPYKQDK